MCIRYTKTMNSYVSLFYPIDKQQMVAPNDAVPACSRNFKMDLQTQLPPQICSQEITSTGPDSSQCPDQSLEQTGVLEEGRCPHYKRSTSHICQPGQLWSKYQLSYIWLSGFYRGTAILSLYCLFFFWLPIPHLFRGKSCSTKQ